jgi:hypothetical protein
METKKCLVCSQDFEKKIDCSNFNWRKRKCCSRRCSALLLKKNNKGICSNTGRTHFKKGISVSPNTQFKKGDVSYWRGKKNPFFSGENNPKWKGGIYPEQLRIRHSPEMKRWSREVLKRDNYTCVKCGRKRKPGDRVLLEADHIKSFAKYPELRFDLNNGRTLCRECHLKEPTHGVNTTI